jgi:hypothetical protein
MRGHWHHMHSACGVIDTACMIKLSNSEKWNLYANCFTMQKIKNACSVIDTACTVHSGSMTPHARCMRDHWHRMHGAFTIDKQFVRPWQPLKGISIKNIYVLSYSTTTRIYKLKGAIWKKYLRSAVSLAPHARKSSAIEKSNFFAISKQNSKRLLARESGAQEVLSNEKTEGRYSRDTVPLPG